MKLYNLNGIEKATVVENKELTEYQKLSFFQFRNIGELNALVSNNAEKSAYGFNSEVMSLGGQTINAWTQWYFPLLSDTDMIGFACYPDASKMFLIGHGKNNIWYASRVL